MTKALDIESVIQDPAQLAKLLSTIISSLANSHKKSDHLATVVTIQTELLEEQQATNKELSRRISALEK